MSAKKQSGRNKVPNLPPDDPIARVNELISTAKTNWLALLAYLAFIGVTLMGVEDADFFLTERQTTLPLVGVTVPTALFFYIAPTLGAMLYIHLHLYLMKLWRALGELPESHIPIAERISPWIVAEMALGHRPGTTFPYPLRRLASFVAKLSIFAACPIVLAAFWWRSMPKHDEALTVLFCGVPLLLCLLIGDESGKAMRRGTEPPPRRTKLEIVGWSLYALALFILGWMRTEGTLSTYISQGLPRISYNLGLVTFAEELQKLDESAGKARWWMQTPFPSFLASAQLSKTVFVQTPPGWLPRDEAEQVFRFAWCKDHAITALACGGGPLERDDEGDLLKPSALAQFHRGKWCEQTLGNKVTGDACKKEFEILDVIYTLAWNKKRQYAIDALPRLNLRGADLRGAYIWFGQLEGANLWRARLEGADLSFARLEGALMAYARLKGAKFSGARLEGAVLMNARLEGADLSYARFEGAVLSGARLEGANLKGARLENIKLHNANKFSEQLKSAFGDGSTSLPEGVSRPSHWSEAELDRDKYNDELKKWRADPTVYRRPATE